MPGEFLPFGGKEISFEVVPNNHDTRPLYMHPVSLSMQGLCHPKKERNEDNRVYMFPFMFI